MQRTYSERLRGQPHPESYIDQLAQNAGLNHAQNAGKYLHYQLSGRLVLPRVVS